MTRLKRATWRLQSLLLCALLLTVGGVLGLTVINRAEAASVNVGVNPTPRVDIAVSVPSDYPGTFLDFKAQLTEKLIKEGMDPSTFRITNTAVSIDTTDLSTWVVYDHYYDMNSYAACVPGFTSDNPSPTQPWRKADNSCTDGLAPAHIADYFRNNTNTTGNTCKNFDRHIYSSMDDEGKASMVFAGYGTDQLADFAYYPATSDSRRTISFDLDPQVIDPHTLNSYGFLLNAGVSGGNIKGYALIFMIERISGNEITRHNAGLYELTNVSAEGNAIVGQKIKDIDIHFNANRTTGVRDISRITVNLNRSDVTIQYQMYDSAGNLGTIKDALTNEPLKDTGFNGFGPLANYGRHGCSSLSIMRFMNLEMTYEASAFDALKNVQYYQGAEQKYFINLVGASNDAGIPKEIEHGTRNKNYTDGINRMNENEIFYISNVQDGQVITDSTKKEDGSIDHQGLGADNGFIANGDDYVKEMAEYIHKSFVEGKKFKHGEIVSELPLANFYLKNNETGSQLMTIHLQHLVNNNGTVDVMPVDKSRKSSSGSEIVKYRYKVYDPENKERYDSGDVTDFNAIKPYKFDKNSTGGRWNFELTVWDADGKESKVTQTYLVAFLDNVEPEIKGSNYERNKFTVTLTDYGDGIDDDGITFIRDNRGSGVEAYWVTSDPSATPTENDWIKLDTIQHQFSFEKSIYNKKPIIVWVRDECGNIGNKAVFQPTLVRIEDEDGNSIEEYYVIDDNPIVVLPEDEPEPKDDPEDNKEFSGWGTPEGDPVTPETKPKPNDDHELILRPNFSTETVSLVYLANGGTIAGKPSSAFSNVVANSAIDKKVKDHKITPVREGYDFVGWKLLKSGSQADADNPTYINNAANLQDYARVLAAKVTNSDGVVIRDTYYLVAQWKPAKYTVHYNGNGGTVLGAQAIRDVEYGTNVGTLRLPLSGTDIPTKPGCIFLGWSTQPNADNKYEGLFKAPAKTLAPVTPAVGDAPIMPAHDITVYAVWYKDAAGQFVVSFDTDGGSKVNASAYSKSSDTHYNVVQDPTKPGYTFEKWVLLDGNGQPVADKTYPSPTAGDGEFLISKLNNQKVDQTYKAIWKVNDNTPYSIVYAKNNGKKDAQGQYMYDAVDTVSKTGTTETLVPDIRENQPELIKDTITDVDGVTYWFNEDATSNRFSGTITGAPPLVLQLCYDRYFNVKGEAQYEGNGASGKVDDSKAKNIKEGGSGTVSWSADSGSHVSRVYVDGQVRDDLLTARSVTLDDIHEDHRVEVVFAKGVASSTKDDYYRVDTEVLGCTDPSMYTITPSQSVERGTDVHVEWSVNSEYYIEKVTVDGRELTKGADGKYPDHIDFSSIGDNHKVIVELSNDEPKLGGTAQPNRYTITVNRYGGGEGTSVSPTQTVVEGASVENIEWTATPESGYEVYKVLFDGKPISLGSFTHHGFLTQCSASEDVFNDLYHVSANHVVDIYFQKTDGSEKEFTGDDAVKVTTQIIGAEGTITGGAMVKPGTDYDISWSVNNLLNPKIETDEASNETYLYSGAAKESADYSCYVVESVTVKNSKGTQEKSLDEVYAKGDKGEASQGKLQIPVTEDTHVEVRLRPVKHEVNITKYGEGTVSPSRIVWHGQDYKSIKAEPAYGWFITRIVVDGETTYQRPADEESKTDTPEAQNAVAEALALNDEPVVTEAPADETVEAPADETAPSVDAVAPQADEIVTEDEATDEAAQTGAVFLRRDANFTNALFKMGSARLLNVDNETANNDSVPDQVNIVKTHNIEVYFTTDGKIPDDPCNVGITVDAPAGCNVQYGYPTKVERDSGAKVPLWWEVPTGYTVKSVTLDGVDVLAGATSEKLSKSETTGMINVTRWSYEVTDIKADRNLHVVIEKDPVPGSEDVPPVEPTPSKMVKLTTCIVNGAGKIGPTTCNVEKGSSPHVKWTVDKDKYDVVYVFVSKDRLASRNSDEYDPNYLKYLRNTLSDNAGARENDELTISNIQEDTTVIVILTPKGQEPTNVDKNGDGIPELLVPKPDKPSVKTPDDKVEPDGYRDGVPDGNEDTRKLSVTTNGHPGANIGSGNTSNVAMNGSVTATWTFEPGYKLDRVTITVNGETNEVTPTADGKLVLEHLTENTIVDVYAKRDTSKVVVTASIDKGGSISPAVGSYDVNPDKTTRVTWNVRSGYKVASVMLDSAKVADEEVAKGYIDVPLNRSHDVVVTTTVAQEKEKEYKLTTSIDNGTIDPAGVTVLKENTKKTVSWTVADGYKVTSVKVNGMEIGPRSSYTVTMNDNIEVVVTTARDDSPQPKNFTLTTSINNGGKITATKTYKEGAQATVEWKAAEGFKVDSVTVDGEPVNANGSYTLTMDKDHKIEVKTSLVSQEEQKDTFLLSTSIDNGGTITEGGRYAKGTQKTIEWKAAVGYKVVSVTVNGNAVDPNSPLTLTMDEAKNVVVTTAKEQDKDKDQYFRLSTSIDNGGDITSGGAYLKDAKVTVTWTPQDGYKVDSVTVDDQVVDADGSYELTMDKAHKIVVKTSPVEQKDKEEFSTLITSIDNGGEITSGGTYKKADGTQVNVTWKPAPGYKVDTVKIDDEVVANTGFVNLTMDSDHKVEVSTSPITGKENSYLVTAHIDHGTVEGGGLVLEGQNSTITWKVADGFKLDRVFLDTEEQTITDGQNSFTLTGVTKDHVVKITTVADPERPSEDFAAKLSVDTDEGATAEVENVKAPFSGSYQKDCTVGKDDSRHVHTVSWKIKEGYELMSVTVDGEPLVQGRSIISTSSDSVTFSMDRNHSVSVTTRRVTPPPAEKNLVSVVFEGNGANAGWSEGTGYFGSDEAVDVKWGAREGYKVVEVRLNDGPADEALLAAGEWKSDGLDDDTVIHVVIEKDGTGSDDPGNDDPKDPGNDDPKDPGNDDPKDPTDDPKDPGSDDPKDPGTDPSDPSNPDSLYHQVTITINNGSVTGTQLVHHGDSHTVTWKPADGTEVRYVFVNGVPRQDLIKDGGLVFSAVNQPEHVVVVTAKPGEVPTNIDTDGDGEPDLNIDTDNDGKPDINVDTDGDGKPDLNVDSDGDGKPDVNIDTNGDGIPDQNIDQVWRDRISATNRLPWTGGSAGSFGSYGSAIIGRLLPKTGDPAASVAAISTLLASSGAIAASAVLIRSRRRDDDEF